MSKCICPVCWHEATMQARAERRAVIHDDPVLMHWRPRGGVHGQVITRWDAGCWTCRVCEFSETAATVAILLDAALRCSDPECDSIVDGVHDDVRVAAAGGNT